MELPIEWLCCFEDRPSGNPNLSVSSLPSSSCCVCREGRRAGIAVVDDSVHLALRVGLLYLRTCILTYIECTSSSFLAGIPPCIVPSRNWFPCKFLGRNSTNVWFISPFNWLNLLELCSVGESFYDINWDVCTHAECVVVVANAVVGGGVGPQV